MFGRGLIDGISTCGQRGRQERVNVFDWLVNVLVVSLTHSFLCSGVRDVGFYGAVVLDRRGALALESSRVLPQHLLTSSPPLYSSFAIAL